jgi:hypothetical protein|tara:strand:- start:299 stop:499 length:201 start_codon:yes stop_codon:yes gene_type:complete
MTSYELIKKFPKLSDVEAFQISKIILGHKNIIIDHAKKILERDQEIYELKVKLGIIKEEPKEDEKI